MDLAEKVALGVLGTISAIGLMGGIARDMQQVTPFTFNEKSYNFKVSYKGYTVGLDGSPAQTTYILDSNKDGVADSLIITSPSKFGPLTQRKDITQQQKDIYTEGYSTFFSR